MCAPRELQIDPTFYLVQRCIIWISFATTLKSFPMWLNYPLLPSPKDDREPTKTYMLQTCEATILKFKGIADLACLMPVKIMNVIKVCIKTFPEAIKKDTPWTRFLEGQSGLCWDLQKAPSPAWLMGFYARVQFLPSHYMVTSEEAFYTGLFKYQSSIFGTLFKDYRARFVAYQAIKMKNPLHIAHSSIKR